MQLPLESFQFEAGILLEQETLLPGTEAVAVIRPILNLNGEAVAISTLKNVHLTITTTDRDGISSISETKDFALFDERESTRLFRVPDRLAAVTVEVRGEIPSISRPGEKDEVRDSRSFEVNGVDASEIVADTYLRRSEDGYIAEVLGKTGEVIAERPLYFQFQHRDFNQPIQVTLKTDESGRALLGDLPGIVSLSARSDKLTERHWDLSGDRVSTAETIHAAVGEVVTIPVGGTGRPLDRAELAIFETRTGAIVEDHFGKAQLENGIIKLVGLMAGDYEVFLKYDNKIVKLKVTDSPARQFGYSVSDDRHLQRRNDKPLQITSLSKDDERLLISLENADSQTRVHVIATRFLPRFDPFEGMNVGHRPPLFEIARGTNSTLYLSGRDIGEEYRYILERRSMKKFPGNLLPRPGLILNPWELSETSTSIDEAAEGEAYRKSREMQEAGRSAGKSEMPPADRSSDQSRITESPAFNFLSEQAVVLSNLTAAEDGTLSIDLADLGDRQHVHVLAVNHLNTVARQIVLPETKDGIKFRDLRLETSLDRGKHFTERRNVTLLEEGKTLTVEDFRAAEVETYDTVGGIYGTLLGINPDENFSTFAFLTGWNDLDETEKRELYSEYACNELNFFLYRKDPGFFESTVQAYLKNKKDKTFLDHYLVGNPLD